MRTAQKKSEEDVLVAKKSPLAEVAAERILFGIRMGRWKRILPGEFALAEMLEVSRETVRAALALLASRNVLRRQKGMRTVILGKGRSFLPPGTMLRWSAF